MGDGHHGPLVVLQVLLQPRDRLGVEMVGRLVEQQQVGLAQQQPAHGHAAALAAGERGHVGVGRRAAQRVHRVLERGVEVPAVDRVDLLLDARELIRGLLGVVHRELVEAIKQGADLRDAVLDVALDVLGRVEVGLLGEQPDGRLGAELGLALVLGVQAGHDPQQGRFTGAVVAEHADLGPRVKGQGDVLEDLLVRGVPARELVRGEDVLGRHGLLRIGGRARRALAPFDRAARPTGRRPRAARRPGRSAPR